MSVKRWSKEEIERWTGAVIEAADVVLGDPLRRLGFEPAEGERNQWYARLRYRREWLTVEVYLEYRETEVAVRLFADGDREPTDLYLLTDRMGRRPWPPPLETEEEPTLRIVPDATQERMIRRMHDKLPHLAYLPRILELGPDAFREQAGGKT